MKHSNESLIKTDILIDKLRYFIDQQRWAEDNRDIICSRLSSVAAGYVDEDNLSEDERAVLSGLADRRVTLIKLSNARHRTKRFDYGAGLHYVDLVFTTEDGAEHRYSAEVRNLGAGEGREFAGFCDPERHTRIEADMDNPLNQALSEFFEGVYVDFNPVDCPLPEDLFNQLVQAAQQGSIA